MLIVKSLDDIMLSKKKKKNSENLVCAIIQFYSMYFRVLKRLYKLSSFR